MSIRLITFDLDNTLWDVHHVIRRAEALCRDFLLAQSPAFGAYDDEAMAALRQQVVEADPALRHDLSRMRETLLFTALHRAGHPEAEARDLAAAAFRRFLDARHEVSFFDDALATLEQLAADYQLAALTNGNADFRRLGLDRFFDFGLSAADVGASKPHPAIFEAALERSSVPAAQAVHVGDHLVDDIQGAGQVGMHTIWVTRGAAEDHADDAPLPPTEVVKDLVSLPAAVGTIRERLSRAG